MLLDLLICTKQILVHVLYLYMQINILLLVLSTINSTHRWLVNVILIFGIRFCGGNALLVMLLDYRTYANIFICLSCLFLICTYNTLPMYVLAKAVKFPVKWSAKCNPSPGLHTKCKHTYSISVKYIVLIQIHVILAIYTSSSIKRIYMFKSYSLTCYNIK